MNIRAKMQFPAGQGNQRLLLRHARGERSAPSAVAFTLLELLVVITIIGLLAAIGLPAIRGMTKSNAITAAVRQMLDDFAYARRQAIAQHTTVYIVFVPPNIGETVLATSVAPDARPVLTNLYQGQYTSYALLALRSVGDQPGTSTPRYLTDWRTLPNGVFIATNKFTNYNFTVASDYARAFPNASTAPQYAAPLFPFPIVSTNIYRIALPFIGFDYLGQLISTNFEGEAIPLARGSILYTTDAQGYLSQADVLETPVGNSITESNVIHIDWLTGKARVERQEVQ